VIGALVVALLAAAALAYVIAPLRRPDSEALSTGPSLEEEAQERKGSALTAIVDLEDEARVGKLTQEELEPLREEYEREALLALEQLDQLAAPPRADDPLEAEIAAMKERLACPSCGAVRTSGGTCSRCDA
jgi:hypothetical protein